MERSLEKKLLSVLLFFSLPLLFFPKINLISFEDQTAGIRIDDIILCSLALFLTFILIARNKWLEGIEKWVLLVTLTSMLSFSVNKILFSLGLISVKSSLFYTIRLPEYFVYFYLGAFCSRLFDLKKVILLFLGVNIFLMVLQKGGIFGQFTAMSHFVMDTSRVCGIASFPSEMGALLSMIFCYFLYLTKEGSSSIAAKSLQGVGYLILFFLLIFLTGSRLPLAVVILGFIGFQYCIFKKHLLFGIVLAGVIALAFPLTLYLSMNEDSLFERSLNLLSFENLTVVSKVWNFIDIDRELYDNMKLESGNYDMSWLERSFKWCFALKTYISHPECYLLGVGPGCFSSAVDGSFIRILTENGLLGALLYYRFFRSIYRSHRALSWMFFAFFMNMIFFDIYLAYKPMSLLLLMTGYYALEEKERVFV